MLLSIKTYQYYVISPDTINVGSVSMLQPVNGIIDVHAHIIPKADDGSRYLGETRFMLKEAYAQGIRSVIATPHYLHRHNKMSAGQILDALEKVKKMAGEIAPDLTIYSGEELFYHDGIVEALQSGRALSLGGTRYVLIEFSTTVSYKEIYQAVRQLTLAGYIPVLAHIERFTCLRKSGCIEELIQAGAYMQMNYSSLSGINHPVDRIWCRKAVKKGNIHLLGSDMHRLDYRPPEIKKAVDWLLKDCKRETFERLTYYQPKKLLNGELF